MLLGTSAVRAHGREVHKMRRICILLMGSILPTLFALAADDVAYTKHWVQGVPVHVVTANLNSPNVKVSPAIARHGIGTSEGFGSMLSRLKPAAAITGTYFCMRSLIPVGHIAIDSKLVNPGCVGTPVCFTSGNAVEFKMYNGPTPRPGTYESVLAGGPRLVKNGVVSLSPRTEGFHDGHLYRPAQRSAMGITKYNKLLLVTVNRPIYMSKLAKIMRELGAVDAINLDGGGSTALFCDGRTYSHPGRRLTNLIVVYETQTQFARAKSQLAPSPVIAATQSKS